MATVDHGDKAFIVANGPLKIEYIYVTAVTTGDTISSKLASPIFARATRVGSVATGNAVAATITVAGGKGLTLTHDAGGTISCLVEVFGDAVWS
jgi:hypothetical protein